MFFLYTDAFWDFLYSDEWDDSVILRVFSGELYNKLDLKLNEMLKEDKITRHVTCAYLKVKNKKNKMKVSRVLFFQTRLFFVSINF